MDEQQDYTIDQVAKIIQVNRKTVEKWINDGKLEAYEIGGNRKRIKPADLEMFKQRRRVNPDARKLKEDGLALAG